MTLARLSLQSERYASSGSIGENARRLLGTPSSDPLQTVIRESIQNIVDAALPGNGPEILIRVRSLRGAQLSALRNHALCELPKDLQSSERFAFLNRQRPPVVMEICDFGTKGLGGPTRADRIPRGPTSTDFIDFVRNIGTPRNTPHGGGTYGFGKVALYGMSQCATVLIDSLVAKGGADARRLIGAHLGPTFGLPGRGAMLTRFTGRHWWGQADSSGFVEPLLDSKAARLAEALGLPERPPGRSGTSLMIVDLALPSTDPQDVRGRLVEAILWNFWPRLMDDTPSERRLRVSVEVEGNSVDIPPPETLPPLDLFCEAMRDARAGDGADVRTIKCGKPRKTLGELAVRKGLRAPRRPLVEQESLTPDICHHIALMRPVELVVRYLDGKVLPNEKMEWAGVFLASHDGEVERAFADSEPPTHDDWIPDSMERGRARTFVNVAMRQLRHHAHEMGATPRMDIAGDSSQARLARLAGRLGAALLGPIGDGAGPNSQRNISTRRPRTAQVSTPRFLRLERDEEGVLAVFEVKVRQDTAGSGVELRAAAGIAIDGSSSTDTSLDDVVYSKPSIARILGPSRSLSTEGSTLPLSGAEGTFEVHARMPSDAAVVVQAHLVLEPPS